MTQKYADMLASGVPSNEISAAMKADGLSIPERGAAWDIIKPRTVVASDPAPAGEPKVCKFQQAAIALIPFVRNTSSQKFVDDVASGLPSLSAKQKKWLKSLADKNGIALKYIPRAVKPIDSRTAFTNRNYMPSDEMDIPVWSEQLGCWVDAEY